MSVMWKCTGHSCWDCRANFLALPEIEDCGHRFTRLHNISVVRRLYQERQYYFPCFFRWEEPQNLIRNIEDLAGHRIILMDEAGNYRPGILITPHSAQTEYETYGNENIWIRWSINQEKVLVYPLSSTVAYIDLETYSDRLSHPLRIKMTQNGKFELEEDFPF